MQFDQLKRREFITLLGGAVAAWPIAARAQQGERMRRIGVLLPAPSDDSTFRPGSGRSCRGWGKRAGPSAATCESTHGRLRVGKSFFTLQHWSVQPCVRPVSAVHVTAGHNALRGSGPGHNLAFDNAVAHVGCPDRRIDRLCITCCSPLPNHHITPRARRDLVHAASATGSLYRSPLAMIAQAILAILFASAMAATLVGRRANKAVSHGRCLVPWILA